MDIVTEGRERFEVMKSTRSGRFCRRRCSTLQDEPDRPTPEEIAQAMKLHGEILALAGAAAETFRKSRTRSSRFIWPDRFRSISTSSRPCWA